ncbi:DUF1800 family protein [Pelagerythrobacter sp.]|uniref:DUF1800 domain-containing protein n=1 Tax=Pelagerythrobacter sp. TaxID=2800702 RepID=UPI0035AD8EA8
MSELSIALNRFGLGARGGTAPPGDPRADLLWQIDRYDPAPPAIAALPGSSAMIGRYAELLRARRELREQRKADDSAAQGRAKGNRKRADGVRGPLQDAVAARLTQAVATETPFAERMVHFWANHFAVSTDKRTVVGLAGPFEAEAIRPHVTGRFADMLEAAVTHPAMLLYLDQSRSIGPESPLGLRVRERGRRQRGLNENLGREVLELHTLGAGGGYEQADVIELAKALTGWTVAGAAARDITGPTGTRFAARTHEPGARTIMGKRYGEGGAGQLRAILADLAVHPSTARHVATKLARHFAGDTPPPALVDALAERFLATGGDLPALYRVLVERPEAWAATPRFRSPWEWLVAGARATGYAPPRPRFAYRLTEELGQPVWKPGSPAGYDDLAAGWAGSDALMRRVEVAGRIAAEVREVDPRALAPALFPEALSTATADAIARAESQSQGLALLLVSPEMMRK